MALSSLRTLDILFLLTFHILRLSLALSPPDSLTLSTPLNINITDTDIRVPGSNPFTYIGHPTNNLLGISSLKMAPNPCRLRSECALSAQGYFKTDISTPRLLLNISSDFDGKPVPIFIIEDDFCEWVDVEQNGRKSCPPKKGAAVLSFKTLLMQGWIPEATYGIDIQVMAKGALVTHIYTDLQLRDPVPTSS